MSDLFHHWGGDLTVDSTGGIAICNSVTMTTQRIYRRLLTNPGDYVWNLQYGGGLASFVGLPADSQSIESVVRTQLQLEPSVASIPAPQVTTQITDPANGYVVVDIGYMNEESASLSQLSLKLSP
jgi:hypothetical protein